MAEKLREIWKHLVSHQVTRDIDGWVDSFAVDGVMDWPFRLKAFRRAWRGGRLSASFP